MVYSSWSYHVAWKRHRNSSLGAGVPWTVPREPYAQIVGIGANNDGFTDKGVTFPSWKAQAELAIKVCLGAESLPRRALQHTMWYRSAWGR